MRDNVTGIPSGAPVGGQLRVPQAVSGASPNTLPAPFNSYSEAASFAERTGGETTPAVLELDILAPT
jgi:hypothetical protein